MKDLQTKIHQWGQETFGAPNSLDLAIRGNKEMSELISALNNGSPPREVAEECADVMFFLLQICEEQGFDLEEMIDLKFEINKQRNWEKAKDGSFQHKE